MALSDNLSAAAQVLTTLPAQFLTLVLLNTAFILGLLWFLNSVDAHRIASEQAQADARERVLTPILAACMRHP